MKEVNKIQIPDEDFSEIKKEIQELVDKALSIYNKYKEYFGEQLCDEQMKEIDSILLPIDNIGKELGL